VVTKTGQKFEKELCLARKLEYNKYAHLRELMYIHTWWITTSGKEFDERPDRTLCRHWRFNDPFLLHAVTDDGMIPFAAYNEADLQCFSVGQTNPKIAPSRGRISTTIYCMVPWAHKSHHHPKNSISISSAVFAQHIWVTNTQTHTQTDHATCDICSNGPHFIHCTIKCCL